MDPKLGSENGVLTNISYVKQNDVQAAKLKFFRDTRSTFALVFCIGILCIALLTCSALLIANDLSNGVKDDCHQEQKIDSDKNSRLFKRATTLNGRPKGQNNEIPMYSNKEIMSTLMQLESAFSTPYQISKRTKRTKRQLPLNIPDCRGKKKVCEKILKEFNGLTRSLRLQLDHFRRSLIQHRFTNEDDPSLIKLRKVIECADCLNAIQPHEEDNYNDHVNDIFEGQGVNGIKDLLPYFEEISVSDAVNQDLSENEIKYEDDERFEREEPIYGNQQISESTKNNTFIENGTRITEITHKTRITEDELKKEPNCTANEFPNQAGISGRVDPTLGSRQFSPAGYSQQASMPILLPMSESMKATAQQVQDNREPRCHLVDSEYVAKLINLPQLRPAPYVPNINALYSSFMANNMAPAVQMNQMQLTSQSPYYGSISQTFQQPAPLYNPLPKGQWYFCEQPPIRTFQSEPLPFYPRTSPENSVIAAQNPMPTMVNDQVQNSMPVTVINQMQNPPVVSDQKYLSSDMPNNDCNTQSSNENDPLLGLYPTLQDSYPNWASMTDDERRTVAITHEAAMDTIHKQAAEMIDRYNINNNEPNVNQVPQTFGVPQQPDTIPVNGEPERTNFPLPLNVSVINATSFAGNGSSTVPIVVNGTQVNNTEVSTAAVTQVTPVIPVVNNTVQNITSSLPSKFRCKRIIQTIPIDKRCDAIFDCEDSTDEEGCTCKDELKRLNPSKICDGNVDCCDESDEKDCGICKDDEYHCHRSGTCIPKEKRCDQNMDCQLNEDELDCFALTNGNEVILDIDKRPQLNIDGVLTRYDNGVWRPSCFKNEFRNASKRLSAGQKICEYLGFKNVDASEEVVVTPSKLIERQSTVDEKIGYDYQPRLRPLIKRDTENSTCYGLNIRCKPILDKKLNVHMRIDPKSDERRYVWPWEASIYVHGIYRCPALLLDNEFLLGSYECAEGIDPAYNDTVAILGASIPGVLIDGPFQQVSPIVEIKNIENAEGALFRMKTDANMTRYVQPIYLEKRILPASTTDICIALGANRNNERKMRFLQPIVDSCPKCHRCYIDKAQLPECEFERPAGMDWSGNVICLSSSGGWYPAAVFQNLDENCGFKDKQILNSIDYIHAHFSAAVDEPEQNIKSPICDGWRCDCGKCIDKDKVCNGIKDCSDGGDEMVEACKDVRERCKQDGSDCKCLHSEMRCGNGQCVSKEKFCDGKIDCVDGTDEPEKCTCGEYLKVAAANRVCDGVRHCLDKSDEDPNECSCKPTSFMCSRSSSSGTTPCIPKDFVCDGEVDCPNGEDESNEVCWVLKQNRIDQQGEGEVMQRTYGELQPTCFSQPISADSPMLKDVCNKISENYTSGVIIDNSKISELSFVPRNDFYMFQLNPKTWLSMRGDSSFGIFKKPTTNCYRLFVHCY